MSSTSQTLGRYQIIREIARSNDVVYEGYDPVMNRRVAIKELIFPAGGSESQREERLKRFYREAKAAGSLVHPNIVTIFEVGEDQGRHYIAMEYLEGRSLRERLDAEGAIPLQEGVEIMLQVLEALQFAHQKGVIHRDIKPGNIQPLSSGRVVITDFGIARLTFEQSITMDGQVFGTPSYMSPEQVIGKDLDARTDLFSCGIVLYEMLTGSKPFQGDNVVTITHNICNADPPSPPGVPYPVEMVIRKALERSVALRYGSASEMASALKQAVRESQSMSPGAQYGPSPYLPQGHIPGLTPAPPQPDPYGGQTVSGQPHSAGGQFTQTPPPYTGPMPPPYTGPVPPPVGGSTPGHTPLLAPLWLPPPPPRPLLSPRTKQMIGAVLVTFVVGSAIVTLGFAGFVAVNKWYETQLAKENDARYAASLSEAQAVAEENPEMAIQMMWQLEEKLTTEEYRHKVRLNRAVFYEKAGKRYMDAGQYAEAEEMFRSAANDDDQNPAYLTDLGQLYELLARLTSDSAGRRQYYVASTKAWNDAARLAEAKGQDAQAAKYANYAAELQIVVGQSFEREGLLSEAGQAYHLAYTTATAGSRERRYAKDQLDRLTRTGN
jgi:serine/threonine protein kinase